MKDEPITMHEQQEAIKSMVSEIIRSDVINYLYIITKDIYEEVIESGNKTACS